MSRYFSNLPNIYVGYETEDETIGYRLVKNIFRRVIIEEKLQKYSNEFEAFTIPDGYRPETIAHKFYGDPELDWIVLIANNIIDVHEQWPLSDNALLKLAESKYSDLYSIHHWETYEVKYNDIIFLKSGVEVNEEFRVTLPNGVTLAKDQTIYPVTNMEYETYENEKKRLIGLPTTRLVEFFEEEFRDLVDYLPNAEIDDVGNKKTVLSSVGKFLNRTSYRSIQTSSGISTFS